MKKIIYVIMFSFCLFVRSASATITIDTGEFLAKVKDWGMMIGETELKKIMENNQGVLAGVQGFKLPDWKEYLREFLLRSVGAVKFEKRTDSAQEKSEEIARGEQQNYSEGIKESYKKRYGIAQDELAQEEAALRLYNTECGLAGHDMNEKRIVYEAVRGQGGEKERDAYNEYAKAVSYRDDMCATADELTVKIAEQKESIKKLEEDMSKVGTSVDTRYNEYEKRTGETENNGVDETLYQADASEGEINQSNDWAGGDDKAENYKPQEDDYKSFYDRYFYDPKNITLDPNTSNGTEISDKAVLDIKIQAASDKVRRGRTFLLANTTAHLLQVTASVRREIPDRSQKAKDEFDETKSDKGEYAAINAYTATKIENARALLLYAKLQSAKLQYAAVHELHRSDIQLEREGNPDDFKYGEIDMNHYVLTAEYVEQLLKESNSTEVTGKLMSEEANTWRTK